MFRPDLPIKRRISTPDAPLRCAGVSHAFHQSSTTKASRKVQQLRSLVMDFSAV
jgi:hypothetical protein